MFRKLREMLREDSLHPEVEEFRKGFPVTRQSPHSYVVWENRLCITGIQHGLGTIYFWDIGVYYSPARNHSRYPGYTTALKRAEKLGLKII